MKSPITASHSCRQKKWVLLKQRHLIRQNERLKFSQQQPIFTTNGRLNRIRHARLPLTHLACRIGTQFSDDLNVDHCRGIGSGTGRLITEIGTVGLYQRVRCEQTGHRRCRYKQSPFHRSRHRQARCRRYRYEEKRCR
jgi:hypothetical protein